MLNFQAASESVTENKQNALRFVCKTRR